MGSSPGDRTRGVGQRPLDPAPRQLEQPDPARSVYRGWLQDAACRRREFFCRPALSITCHRTLRIGAAWLDVEPQREATSAEDSTDRTSKPSVAGRTGDVKESHTGSSGRAI